MNAIGHNENAIRLAALAGDAQIALDKVAKGEADAIDGWLAYGAALNEGRGAFESDKAFGQWIAENRLNLLQTFGLKREAHSGGYSDNLVGAEINDHERAAAMWAAANADQLAEAKANSKARTLRGWHDQWKKIEQDRKTARQKAERDAEKKRLDEAAATARREAEEKAKAEKEAQKAIAAANTDEDREIAEAKAEKVAVEKAEADRVAVEAESAAAKIEITAPEVDAETAKVMRELAKMTPEGVAGLVMELRVALADEKAKRRTFKAEADKLKERLNEHTGDKDEVIRRLNKTLEHKSSEMFRANEKVLAEKRKTHALEKRVKELEQAGVMTL